MWERFWHKSLFFFLVFFETISKTTSEYQIFDKGKTVS